MRELLKGLRNTIKDLVRREPSMRFGRGDADWMPPALGPTHWSGGFFLGRCYRDSIWYFERSDYPEGR